MTQPVSVIVPHITSRRGFFASASWPRLLENDPGEIIVILGEETAAKKRNEGAAKASHRYLFFADDDIVLKEACLPRLVAALEADPQAAFAYGDFEHVVHPGVEFPVASSRWSPGPFDQDRLRRTNYISANSMVRREAFPGWDESFLKLEDWDLWLTIAERGGRGVYVPEILHESHHIDRGVTVALPTDEWVRRVKAKHGLAA